MEHTAKVSESFQEVFTNAGRKPSIPLIYDRSKKIQLLIYLEMERMEENDLVLRRFCFHSDILNTLTLLIKFTPGSGPRF